MNSTVFSVVLSVSLLCVGCGGSTSRQSAAKHGTSCMEGEGVVVVCDRDAEPPEINEPDYVRH